MKKFLQVILILILCLLTSCQKETKPAQLYDYDKTLIMHGGGGAGEYTYLNSQETFEYYYKKGLRYFEYDLKLSIDNRLIATHGGEYLPPYDYNNILYDDFIKLELSNSFTPVNEDWLIDTIKKYPDVKFVIDAKMNTTVDDARVLQRFEELETIHNIDLSDNIIPEVFDLDMWNILKDTTSFNEYFYSQYKHYYTVIDIIHYFSDERISSYCFDKTANFTKEDYDVLKRNNKKINFFTINTKEDEEQARYLGVDGYYIDFLDILEKNN